MSEAIEGGVRSIGRGALIRSKLFSLAGMLVEERLHEEWEPGKNLILWVRVPLEQRTVAGLPNPMIHAKYNSTPDGETTVIEQESNARLSVSRTFAEHWRLEVTPRHLYDVRYLLVREDDDPRKEAIIAEIEDAMRRLE